MAYLLVIGIVLQMNTMIVLIRKLIAYLMIDKQELKKLSKII